jgi:hypothetical protein
VTAAVQAAESVRFAQSQVEEQMAANVHPKAIGRGIAEQIGWPAVSLRRSRPGGSTMRGSGGLSSPTPTVDSSPADCTSRSPGWHITVINAGLLDKPHTLIITTPTGHHYLSRAPRPAHRTVPREVRPSLRPMPIRPMV